MLDFGFARSNGILANRPSQFVQRKKQKTFVGLLLLPQ
jgi:hypothetical protein